MFRVSSKGFVGFFSFFMKPLYTLCIPALHHFCLAVILVHKKKKNYHKLNWNSTCRTHSPVSLVVRSHSMEPLLDSNSSQYM